MKINSFLGIKPVINTNKSIYNNTRSIFFSSCQHEPKDTFVASKPKELDVAIQRINSDNDINPTIKDRLTKLCATSKHYSPLDYVDNFIRLAYFTNHDEEATFPNFNVIENIMKIDPGSVDASYMQTIIELVQSGDILPEAIYYPDNDFKFNEALLGDIELLYDVISKNTDKSKIKEELLNAYIPNVKSEAEGIEKSKVGDAFVVENENYIRIKTDEKSSKLMQISKETYNELFPMFKRFSAAQNEQFGDCYLIEPLMLLYQDPNERAKIVSIFRETEDGNIVVKFPNRDTETTFESGELPFEELESTDAYSNGADGYKLLEYSYARCKREELIEEIRSLRKGKSLERFNAFLEKNGENIFIDEDTKRYKTFTSWQKENNDSDETFNQYLIANGGRTHEVLEVLGYDNVDYSSFQIDGKTVAFALTPEEKGKTQEEIIEILQASPKTSIENVANIMKSDGFFDSFNVFLALDRHQYGLKKVQNSSGEDEYRLFNPHCQALPSKVENIEELLTRCSRIDFTEKTNYNSET